MKQEYSYCIELDLIDHYVNTFYTLTDAFDFFTFYFFLDEERQENV